jgi:hypothetical protein
MRTRFTVFHPKARVFRSSVPQGCQATSSAPNFRLAR